MKKESKNFEYVSTFAFGVLIALVVFAIFTNSLIMLSPILNDPSVGFPSSGTIGMLFDYGVNAGHPMQMLGQVLSNIVAYVFIIAAIVVFVLSLVLIKHDKKIKVKCALLGCALLIPAVFGFTGGIIDFFGHGFVVLNTHKGVDTALVMAGFICTLILDVVFLFLAIKCLISGIGTAVKINKGEIEPEPEEEKRPDGESAEDRAAREEREAAERVEMLNNIRQIVREEIDKQDRVVIATEVEVKKVVKEEPKPAPAPAPAEEEEDDEAKKLSIQRIPFAEKIVKADKELQEKYNELKSEFLSYGCSSRVSIAGDTFRLHRKAYAKITLVGKTLKVYFALDPKDFVDSPIPVVDASDKVAYEEVPALLKVKSNLSVKRAKELIELAFQKDGVKREAEAQPHNWVKDIRAELRAKK